MYPEAKIPVLQLSIDYHKPAQYHYDLAKEISELRKKGVLIIVVATWYTIFEWWNGIKNLMMLTDMIGRSR
jgi:hypothetical protein